MSEINSTEVIIQPVVPKAVDNQQVIVYIPTANTGSYGVIKLETDDLNPDVIAPNGILQLRNGRVLQTKVDIKEQQGYVYSTPNDIILYTENATPNSIVYRNNDGNFNSGDAISDDQVVNLRVLKRELGEALVEYDAINIKNGKGTGSLVQRTTNNVNDASFDYSSAFGYGTKVSNVAGFSVGTWNKCLTDSIFEVGVGHKIGETEFYTRKTGFAVYKDGRAMVFASPKEDKDVVRKLELDTKLDKAGGTISGSLIIAENLTVQGKTTSVDTQNLKVADKLIYVAKDNTIALTSPAGLITPKYDGTNNGGIVYDNTGTAYVGDITLDSNGNVDVNNSDLQPIATRNATITNGNLVKWDGTNHKLVDAGQSVDNLIDLNIDVLTQEQVDLLF